jgi:hypothetical protein
LFVTAPENGQNEEYSNGFSATGQVSSGSASSSSDSCRPIGFERHEKQQQQQQHQQLIITSSGSSSQLPENDLLSSAASLSTDAEFGGLLLNGSFSGELSTASLVGGLLMSTTSMQAREGLSNAEPVAPILSSSSGKYFCLYYHDKSFDFS